MANHGYVTTKQTMKPEAITELLNDLNKRLFNGNLKIEYSDETENKHAWGPHVWMIEYISLIDKRTYARRVCWLKTGRKFEMRHGGGSNFDWWVDNAVTNQVAIQYNGNISDDGVGGKWPGEAGKFDDYQAFLGRMHEHVKEDLLRRYLIQLEMESVPPEIRWDTGEKVEWERVAK